MARANVQPAGHGSRSGTATLAVLRVFAALHTLLVLLQPILAGQLLAGNEQAVDLHLANARLVVGAGALQLVAVIFVRHRPSSWLFIAIGLLLAEIAQFALGFNLVIAVHVPLGVAIFGAALAFLIAVWAWRPAAA
jgi:hypothetical protein